MKIAVCDDIVEWTRTLLNLLKQYNFETETEIDTYITGEELIKNIHTSPAAAYDIVFLDIELENNSFGIDYGKKIKDNNVNTILIYISCHLGYFREMTQSEPFDFIEKPFTKEKVFKVLDRAMKRIDKLKPKNFAFEYCNEKYYINLNDILYFESRHRIITIHTEGRVYEFYDKLDNVQNKVDSMTDMFARPNKSCYVNLDKIEKYSSKNVTIKNEIIPVSRKYASKFMSKIFDFY